MAYDNRQKTRDEFDRARAAIRDIGFNISDLFNTDSLFSLWQLTAEHTDFDQRVYRAVAFMDMVTAELEDAWPESARPADIASDASLHQKRQYDRARRDWSQAHRFRERQMPELKRWCVSQLLLAWPGRRDAADERMRSQLPDPILTEDYPRYIQSAVWYLRDALDEYGDRRALVAADLKGKTLQDLRDVYDQAFTSTISSQFLQICDAAFLDMLIPDDTPDGDRHPNLRDVTVHAQILGTGLTDDGRTWTLRQINTRRAAMAYGNPSRRTEGSSLCFTWPKVNYFAHSYSNGLMMLCMDDGSNARFIHLESGMYQDIYDASVERDVILNEFTGAEEAIAKSIPLSLGIYEYPLQDEDSEKALPLLRSISGQKKWIEAAAPSVRKILASLTGDTATILNYLDVIADPEEYIGLQEIVHETIHEMLAPDSHVHQRYIPEVLKILAKYQTLRPLGTKRLKSELGFTHEQADSFTEDWRGERNKLLALIRNAPEWHDALKDILPGIVSDVVEKESVENLVRLLEYLRMETERDLFEEMFAPLPSGALPNVMNDILLPVLPQKISYIRDNCLPELFTRAVNAIWGYAPWEDVVIPTMLTDVVGTVNRMTRDHALKSLGCELITDMAKKHNCRTIVTEAAPIIMAQSSTWGEVLDNLHIFKTCGEWINAVRPWLEGRVLEHAEKGYVDNLDLLVGKARGNEVWEKACVKGLKRFSADIKARMVQQRGHPDAPGILLDQKLMRKLMDTARQTVLWQQAVAPAVHVFVPMYLDQEIKSGTPREGEILKLLRMVAAADWPWAETRNLIGAKYVPVLLAVSAKDGNKDKALRTLFAQTPLWDKAMKRYDTGRSVVAVNLGVSPNS